MPASLTEGFYRTSTDPGVSLSAVRRFWLIIAIALGLAYAIGVPMFLERDDDPLPAKADAIVALSGSDQPLPEARSLFEGGLAPTLVVSSDRNGRDAERAALCKKPPKGILCIQPGQLSTFDEARLVGDLALRNHWQSIVLVTPRYQMYRTGRIFDRCVDAKITEHGVDEPWWKNTIAVPLEWIKLAISETVRRSC
jgi:uncharacterized SAM-binding protein YcdF (DUF218 family)